MGKQPTHTPKLTKKFYPFVSVCTPTFNRRPFIPMMFSCFNNQTYPKDRMEWIIVDDGTDPIEDLITSSGISNIRYFKQERKMMLGEKRNFMHSKIKGTIVVYMDDDDYYPPERVQHAVDTLMLNKQALCAGSSEIYVYFKHIQTMYQSGPYGPNHATAGTFAFRTELLKTNRYEDGAALAEEKHFLNNYTVPFVQLDPFKTILVFSHEHNTFDKRKLLENQNEQFFKPSSVTVDNFIRLPKEAHIKQFFMTDIDTLLLNYQPGEPAMKPDVLKQIKEIEAERAKMAPKSIMFNEPGKPPRALSTDEIMGLINLQTEQIQTLTKKNQELESTVGQLQKKIQQTNSSPAIDSLSPTVSLTDIGKSSETSAFVDTLLERIRVLEKGPATEPSYVDSLLKRIQELEEKLNESRPTPKILEKPSRIMEPKSKSTPEVIFNIM